MNRSRNTPIRAVSAGAALLAIVFALAGCVSQPAASMPSLSGGAQAAPAAPAPSAAPATTAPASAAPAAAATAPVTAAPAPLPTGVEQVRLDTLESRFSAWDIGAFAKANLASFTTFTLANGIPVVVKRNEATRVRAISIVLRGGALLTTPAKAGIEGLMLATMARASADTPYAALRAKLDETSSAISASSSFEHSLYTLATLDRYFDELLPLWAATFANPGFRSADFDQVLADARLALKRKEQDPAQATSTAMNQVFFAGHPYAATLEGTKESLASMSLEDIKAYHARTVSANRLFIVAVGDYDPATLRPALEATLGKLADTKVPVPYAAPSFSGRVEARLVKVPFPSSKGVGYLRGDFAAPAPQEADYPAMSLAARMLDDLLFGIVRTRHGAAYGANAYVRGYPSNYGSIFIQRSGATDRVKGYIDEAVAELAAGRAVSMAPRPEEGDQPRQSLADALPFYKALYLNETYEKLAANAAVAGEIARSVILQGDPRAWLLDVDRIAAVTPSDIERVVRERLIAAKLTWVVLGSADVVDPVDPATFTGFSR